MKTRLISLSLGMSLGFVAFGCGAADDPSAGNHEGVPREEDIGQVDQPIYGGTDGGGLGAVEIVIWTGNAAAICSGSLFGTRMVMTASHCFNAALGSATSGRLWVMIAVSKPNYGWKCIHEVGSTGRCVNWALARVLRLYGPNGTSSDVDMAAMFPDIPSNPWPNVNAIQDSAWGIYDGAVSTKTNYKFMGGGPGSPDGTGSGVMRSMSGALDWVGTQSFVADSGQQGVCFGDSGGPFFLNTGPWMFGVLSKMTSTSNSCVPANAKQSGTRMTGTRMTQIQRWRQDQAYPMCDQVSSHYWACP